MRAQSPILALALCAATLAACGPVVAPVPDATAVALRPLAVTATQRFFKESPLPQAIQARKALAGSANLGGPVAGATLRILDDQGQSVGSPLTTSPSGAFSRPLDGLPSAFTVELQGGKVGAKPFAHTLRYRVADLAKHEGLLQVNMASTLLAKAQELNPLLASRVSWAEAQAQLGLSPSLPVWSTDTHLDLLALEADVAQGGGFGPWVEARAQDLLAKRNFPRAYLLPQGNRDTADGTGALAAFVAQKMGSQIFDLALEAGLEKGFGVLLKTAGLNSDPNAPVLNALDQLQRDLVTLEGQLDTELERLRDQTIQGEYDALFSMGSPNLSQMLTNQKSLLGRLDALAHQQADPITGLLDPKVQAQDIQASIQNQLIQGSTGDAIDLWDTLLNQEEGGSLMSVFSRMVGAHAPLSGRVWTVAQAQEVDLWWAALDARMANTMLLEVEALTYAKDLDGAKYAMQRWANTRSTALSRLRGGLTRSDSIDLSAIGQGVVGTRLANFLPDAATAVVRGVGSFHSTGEYIPTANAWQLMGKLSQYSASTGLAGWRSPTDDDLRRGLGTLQQNTLHGFFGALGQSQVTGMGVWLNDYNTTSGYFLSDLRWMTDNPATVLKGSDLVPGYAATLVFFLPEGPSHTIGY